MDCNECVFKIIDTGPPMSGGVVGGGQIGCEAGRLEKYIKSGHASPSVGRPYYELDKFCNMYRDEEGCTVEKARFQIQPTFGIVIRDSLADNTWEEYVELVDHVASANYHPSFLKLVLSSSRKRGVYNICRLVDRTQEKFHHTLSVFQENDDEKLLEFDTFKEVMKASYLMQIKCWEKPEIDLNIFKDIDTKINDDLEVFVATKCKGYSIGLRAAINSLYLECGGFDKTIDHLVSASNERGVSNEAE